MLRVGRIADKRVRSLLRTYLRAGVCILVVAVAAIWWFLEYAPLPAALCEQPHLTGVYLDAKGRTLAELASSEARAHRPCALREMGPWIPRITMGLEDRRFYQHHGVDLRATFRALIRRRGGGSTITQQFVKVATKRKGRSIIAKAREALWALQLERRWTKHQILEAYLNRISYGNRLIGVEAAALAYFDKPASALSQAEAIYLAGLPQRPSQLNPWTYPEAAGRQFARCIQTLERRGELLANEISKEDLPSVGRNLPPIQAPHFVQRGP